MRLEQVEISGFKSFCDRQELSFKGGVTGIVGPNGCGKSNISDAISWVLGEQSAKSLRGASMEDVIFAGSQSRQALGMAEVNLKVSGLNGNSPDGNPECVVTRRLYRNGESEYLMNGTVCRLRDIHELFMDTGLGSKAYSIIEQGKIGQILSGKPADRRALIEEAAGITKYRARRRQTQLKLEAAQQNLLRVNDIVHEVEKQLDSLKRQASRARRYRIVRDEMQGLERILFGRRFVDLRERAESLTLRIGAEAAREQAATIALESEEAQMEARRTVLHEDEERLQDVRTRLNELTLAVDRHQGRSGYCKEQIAETEARAAEARREAGELEARVGPLAEHLAARQAEESRLRAELVTAGEEARASEAAVHEIAATQAGAEAELESAREAQLTVLSHMAALQNAREAVSANAERASADLLKLAVETEELERENVRVAELRDGAQRRQEEADALVARLSGERAGALARAGASREAASDLEREADAAQSERDGLAGRLSSLEEIVATHAAFDEGVRALLAGPDGIEVLGVVADAVETDSQFERAVEALFGDRLQAVLVPDAAHAVRGIAWLEESEAGRGTFLPLASARTRHECATLRDVARVEPGARGLIADLFRVSGPYAEAIRGSLPDALVVETLEQALEIVTRRGPVSCVTLAGETLRGSMVEGGRAVKGLLAPRREIKEVQARLGVLEDALASVRRGAQEHAAAADVATAEARALEDQIHGAEKDLVAIRHDLAAAQDERARLARKAAVLDTERLQAEDERGAAAVRRAEIEQALLTAEQDRDHGHARVTAGAATVAETRVAAEAAQARFSEARSQHAALAERTVAIEAECRRAARDHQELQDRGAAARTRAAEMDQRRSELLAERQDVERMLAEALSERDRVNGEAAVAEDRVRDLRNEIEGREAGLKERRREREMLKEALTELEVTQARTAADLDHLGRECHQAVGMMAAEAAARLTPENGGVEISGLEVQIQEMRERLDRMGPVNILAVEQSQELEERHTFLTAQRQDLLDSIAELDQAIKRIDRTSKERFREAFGVINQHFGDIFRQLFGGGAAGLTLLDEDDILESGIDVMAQPPGKRLQSVMLLSGGEKALTAIALLFAIFQYKPSPFCILDEVDAPLDDANIGRFVRMLDGLKEQTQFVLITHSRKTMEIADQLYGVTMEEPGVSKLVSVRFS